MKLRKNILPRRCTDAFCILLIGVCLPIVVIYDLMIILPFFHEPGGFWHCFTVAVATFLLFNVTGNMLGSMLVDNSVDFTDLKPLAESLSLGWHHCSDCDQLAPPRSWHCEICRACIVKRDHHCLFLGSCVGHRNQRYFMMFVFHLFIGSVYALVYNSIYIWVLQARIYRNWLTLLKTICPLLMFVSGSFWPHDDLMLIFYNLNVLTFVLALVFLLYHGPEWLRGSVSYERGKENDYDLGWRQNLREVLGERMHLVALSPLITSKLPNEEGIEWPTSKQQKQQ